MIKKLWCHLSKRRRNQFFLILILMIFASIMEIISIGAVLPFLGALTSPETIYQNKIFQPLIMLLGITEANQLLFPLTIIFIVATLIAATVRLLLLYASTRLSFAAGADLSLDIYRRTLYQDYEVHTSRNSSDVINSIITKTSTVINLVLTPLINLISSVIIMLGIIGIISTINIEVALFTFLTFALLYSFITYFTKKYLRNNSKLIASESTEMIKSLQEGLGGIRDVLIDNTQEFYCRLYKKSDLSMRKASGNNVFIGSSPRYLMEAIGMILIAILAYTLTLQEGGVLVAIPVLGALAIGAQKLLPALQTAYFSYSAIKGAQSSFMDVLNLLDQSLPHNYNQDLKEQIPFEKDIVFNKISFRYNKDTPLILKNINLVFKKGEKIGFIGMTGSGKSTLLDILMGLLTPTSGDLLVDGVAILKENRRVWQAHISHVPQSIYLTDSTIQENIAFGVELDNIKEDRVFQAAKHAQIEEMINNLKNRYKSFVGERGTQLSGGQRQRIGIARALYRESDVLIFDEATSALDNETERRIMQQISEFKDNQTIFIIAHRLTTLKKCDRIIRINSDYTIDELDYNQIEFN